MMTINDKMITLQLEGNRHGCNIYHSPSFGGHLRPLDNYRRSAYIVWPWVLDNVGHGLGKSDNTGNLCDIRVSSRNRKGEK
jgi:hypothetical protein